jgi:uncharacterized protein (DUF2147 family)
MTKFFIISFLVLFTTGITSAKNDITGKWKTIDDISGEVKAIVEITRKDGKVYGKIIKLFNKDPNYDPVCVKCKDYLKNKKIIGMQIINGLSDDNHVWKGKKGILNPENGKNYNVSLWLDEHNSDKLIVRGYISFFYRTQTWYREK